jgi:hypothetical protein
MTNHLLTAPDTVCSCGTCQGMCSKSRPCWGTPADMQKLIEAGYGDSLMGDWFSDLEGDIHLLSPALVGREGKMAPIIPIGKCTFFNSGKCDLHDFGLKPSEGKKIHCKMDPGTAWSIHMEVVEAWRTEEGRKLVKAWRPYDDED